MRPTSGSDHSAYPLTDLMTSLMVIFILLLLVFLNNQGWDSNAPQAPPLVSDLAKSLNLTANDIRVERASGDFYLVVVRTPIRFELGKSDLSTSDLDFLRTELPKLADIVCGTKYRGKVDEVMVEGQSDSTRYRGSSREDSLTKNLKLSQERAMEVVKASILPLTLDQTSRGCLAARISASGRIGSGPDSDRDANRRVEFKIKMRSELATAAPQKLGPDKSAGTFPRLALTPGPEVLKVLEIFRLLRLIPRQNVEFQLTQNELNTYLEYALKATPRPGIDALQVKLFPGNYVSTLTRLNLDALERSGQGKLLAPFHLLVNGRKEIWLDFRFKVDAGRMTFTVEKAYYQRAALPPGLVKQLIRLTAALQPEHVDTNSPIPLSFNLRSLATGEKSLSGANFNSR